jgi:hypothetical protein
VSQNLLVFDTTHHAVWAEQLILEAGCAAEIIPAPSAAKAKCSLAVAYLQEEEATVLRALDAAGAPYRRYDATTL